jgi:tetratricopeptide (TPR) repeat protein
MVVDAVDRLELPSGERLAARVGIATGPVVIGEMVEVGGAREEAVVGETPNLAARLQALAGPGEVVVADATRRLVGGAFELVALDPQTLHGFDAPVTAWRIGPATLEGRFEALRGTQPAPMVGRERELAWLADRWAEARAGQGRAVLLLGEAGIGKSRLARALLDAVAGEPHNHVRYQCSPQHAESALWPAVEELGRATGQGAGGGLDLLDAAYQLDARLDALEAYLGDAKGGDAAPADAVPTAAETGPRPDETAVSPEAWRQRTLEALTTRLLGLAAARPLLVLVEDAHWIDPTTLDLLLGLTERIADARALLVITARPEGETERFSHPLLTKLAVNRLPRAGVAALVRRLTGAAKVRDAVLDTVAARTDGVPLFVEEFVKALQAEGLSLDGPLPEVAVPASLHDLLMARLDRLGAAKELAQIASCIGREFDHALLQRITQLPEADLSAALARLCAAGLVLPQGDAPHTDYAFKHALVRDAAYESMLRARRRAVHARLVEAFEASPSDASAARIAHHATAAELWERALRYWGQAGKVAMDRASYREAIGLFGRALEAGGHLGFSVEREVTMIDLRRTLSWAAGAAGHLPIMMASLRDAEASAARIGLVGLKCELRTQRAHFESIFGGSVATAVRYGRDALRMAKVSGSPELLAAARFVLGQAHWLTGEYRYAIEDLGTDAPAFLEGLRVAHVATGGTLAVDGLAILGGCLGLAGRLDEAVHYGHAAVEVAGETGNPFDLVVARYHLARSRLVHGDPIAALPLVEANIELARRCGLEMLLPWNLGLHGDALTRLDRPSEALRTLDLALAGCDAVRLQYARVCTLLYRGRACLAGGMGDPAASATEALALAEGCGYRALQVDGLRLLAEAALDAGQAGDAAEHLVRARDIAERLGLAPDLVDIERLSALGGSA